MIHIRIVDGARTRIDLPEPVPNGSALAFWEGEILIAEKLHGRIRRFDPDAGTLTTCPNSRLGQGPPVDGLDVAVAFNGEQTFVLDRPPGRVLAIDPPTANREIAAEVPSKPVSFDVEGSRVFVLDFWQGVTVHDLDLGTIEPVPTEPFALPTDVAVHGDTAYVLDTNASSGTLYAVDLETGARTEVSTGGTGPKLWDFGATGTLTLNERGDRAYMSSPVMGSVFEVDLVTGEREVVSGPQVGSGPALLAPADVAYDPNAGRVLVAERSHGAIVAVDPVSGDRTVLSGEFRGSGPPLIDPRSIDFDPETNIAYVGDSGRVLAVELMTGSRVLVLR